MYMIHGIYISMIFLFTFIESGVHSVGKYKT